MKEQIVVEKPKSKFGVYAWINKSDRIAYVGETCDLNHRLCEHIRSMYGYEKSSNDNLIYAFSRLNKAFVGRILYYSSNYNKIEETKEWLLDETIYMYAFVKNGYKLYNGKEALEYDENGKLNKYPAKLTDNAGNRSFLREKDISSGLDEYCKLYFGKFTKEEIDMKVGKAVKQVKDILENLKSESFIEINVNDAREKCNELACTYLRKEDMENLGILPVKKADFKQKIQNGEFDRIAVCGFGDYLEQSAITILQTKQHDIKNNTLQVKNEDIEIWEKLSQDEKGICMWAYGHSNPEKYRNYLCNGKEAKLPRYLLLPYVQSDKYSKLLWKKKDDSQFDYERQAGESMKDFFGRMREMYEDKERYADLQKTFVEYQKEIAKKPDFIKKGELYRAFLNYILKNDHFSFGYAWDRRTAKNINKCKKYPCNMFPQIIKKTTENTSRNSVSFLISEINYITCDVDDSLLLKCYKTHTGNDFKKTMHGPNNTACGEIVDKKKLLQIVENSSDDNDEIKFLLAKIEYPYVVANVKDPIFDILA